MALFSSEIIIDGAISSSDARVKWDKTAESNARKGKVKGEALFLHSQKDGKYVLHYYANYGGDFCDTVFTGEIFEYDDGCSQITGKVTVSKQIKRFAVGLIAGALPLAFLLNVVLYYAAPFFEKHFKIAFNSAETEYNGIFIFAGAAMLLIAVGIMSLVVDKRKVAVIMDYLQKFLLEDDKK